MQFYLVDLLDTWTQRIFGITTISVIILFLIWSSYKKIRRDRTSTRCKRLICILRIPVIHNSLVTYGGTGGGGVGVIGVNWEIAARRRCGCHEVDPHVTATPAGGAGGGPSSRSIYLASDWLQHRWRASRADCVVVSNWRRSCCKAARAGPGRLALVQRRRGRRHDVRRRSSLEINYRLSSANAGGCLACCSGDWLLGGALDATLKGRDARRPLLSVCQ